MLNSHTRLRLRPFLPRPVILAPLLALILLLAPAAVAKAATFTVNAFSDSADQNSCTDGSTCSLRDAVSDATDGDTIQLPAGTYSVTLGTIDISHSITIEGDTSSDTTIDGRGNSTSGSSSGRIFKVDAGSVVIQELALANGSDSNDENCCGGSTTSLLGGGALYDAGGATVALNDVFLTNNSTFGIGGAISNSGTLNLTNVEFNGDQAGIGGGLFSHGGSVTGDDVTFENDATGATDQAAVYLLGGTATFTNTTVTGSGGASDRGGGIDNGGAALTLDFDTLSNNVRGSLMTDQGATTAVANTIIGNGFSDGDGDCIASGFTDDANNGTTGSAITTDNGNNLDQDSSCSLSGAGDISNQDPKLVPPFNNGGVPDTEALLAGSPALDGAANCIPDDERGTGRDQAHGCDIGAFEAEEFGPPTTATTQAASNVADTSATLNGTINLDGEAGGFHFVYGTSPSSLTSSTSESPAGVVSSDTAESAQVSGLNPGTKYYYSVVADNASGSLSDQGTQSFTTSSDPPDVTNVTVSQVTDTTAKIDFTLADNGANTTYQVAYGTDPNNLNVTSPTPPGSLAAGSGPTPESVTLTGLTPGTQYTFEVQATNSQGSVNSGGQQLTTDQQVAGTVGSPVTVNDSGSANDCPSATIDWGDGTGLQDASADVQCQGSEPVNYTFSDTHTYASTGDFPVQISYDGGSFGTTEYAKISPAPPPQQPTVTSVTPNSGPTAGGTSVTIDGSNFTADSTVEFGNTPATNVVVNTSDEITATSPTEHAGTVDVTVHADGGTSSASQSDQFTYLAPTVTGVSPSSGPSAGGNQVTITGANFTGTSTVKFGSSTAVIKSGTDTQLIVIAPAGSGTVDVTVISSSGDTSAIGAADKYTYITPTPPPPPQTAAPKVASFAPLPSGKTGAELTGEIDPEGLPTTAYYVYGLDGRYQQFGITVYDQSTPKTQLASDFTDHQLPVSLSKLVPNATYHVRLVAQNSAGMTIGPDQTFTTKAEPAPKPPQLGRSVDVKPAGGVVFVLKKGNLVPVTENTRLPSGTVLDALNGSVSLVAASGTGKAYTGTFGGAIFRLTQAGSGPNRGLITLSIVEGAFPGAPSYAECKADRGRAPPVPTPRSRAAPCSRCARARADASAPAAGTPQARCAAPSGPRPTSATGP